MERCSAADRRRRAESAGGTEVRVSGGNWPHSSTRTEPLRTAMILAGNARRSRLRYFGRLPGRRPHFVLTADPYAFLRHDGIFNVQYGQSCASYGQGRVVDERDRGCAGVEVDGVPVPVVNPAPANCRTGGHR